MSVFADSATQISGVVALTILIEVSNSSFHLLNQQYLLIRYGSPTGCCKDRVLTLPAEVVNIAETLISQPASGGCVPMGGGTRMAPAAFPLNLPAQPTGPPVGPTQAPAAEQVFSAIEKILKQPKVGSCCLTRPS